MRNELKKYLTIGIAVFLTFSACLLVAFALFNFDKVSSLVGTIVSVLEPIIMGIIIAYLLNPVMNFCEKRFWRFLDGRVKETEKVRKAVRSASILIALIFGVAIVVSVVWLMMPQLITSIVGIAKEMPGHIDNATAWILEISSYNSAIGNFATETLMNLSEKIRDWVSTDIITYLTKYLGYLTSGVISVFSTALNIVVGLIVAVYVMYSKEKFAGQSKKMVYALLPVGRANFLIETVRKTHEIFGGFIIGKIVDSAIIGVICFVCLSVMKMPYTLLISVIVGVTNVIPFFGPFIGAVPGTIILLLVSPIKALYFVIFVLILQQVDGNIIGPAILGESTGLSAFWVVFSIMLFGGLFGVIGMIIGVPTVALFFYMLDLFLDHNLHKKNFTTDSDKYIYLKEISDAYHSFVYFDDEYKKDRPKKFRLFNKKMKEEEKKRKAEQK